MQLKMVLHHLKWQVSYQQRLKRDSRRNLVMHIMQVYAVLVLLGDARAATALIAARGSRERAKSARTENETIVQVHFAVVMSD